MAVFLGIDTSNYTTSVAAFDSRTGEMISEKVLLPVAENNCGLRQSDAVFLHVRQLGEVASRVLSKLNDVPEAVGISIAPCDSEGSYMPCFLVGKMLGQALSAAYNAKLYAFSHQRGHIAAALYSVGHLEMLDTPFFALHVSGGTTDLIKVTPDKEKIIFCECIGKSLDLKAGQAIDRVGVMLGLRFPCGPQLEALSQNSQRTFKIKPCIKGLNCALSGLENQAQKMLGQNEEPCDIAKYCLDYVCASIDGMCSGARERYPQLPFVFAGGVMSNIDMRTILEEKYNGLFAEPKYSSDNAAGIAVLSKTSFERNLDEFLTGNEES